MYRLVSTCHQIIVVVAFEPRKAAEDRYDHFRTSDVKTERVFVQRVQRVLVDIKKVSPYNCIITTK